ncbi:hypothetical protein LEP1GSC041_0358 [Leptospira noguchii str. 2006001870]|nr:hypothetical protein LEP1GSC041_0358 [Leptospira noguchii str. 2006001870]
MRRLVEILFQSASSLIRERNKGEIEKTRGDIVSIRFLFNKRKKYGQSSVNLDLKKFQSASSLIRERNL